MPPRSVRAPEDGDEREPRHSDLMAALSTGLAASEARAEERHKAVLRSLEEGDKRFVRIEASVLQLATGQAEAKGAALAVAGEVERLAEQVQALAQAAPAPAPATPAAAVASVEHDGGLAFKHGWRSWAAVGLIAIGILGGIEAAFEKAGAFLLNFSHLFAPPPAH